MDRMKVVKIARTYEGVKKGSELHHKLIDTFNTVKPDGYTAKYSDHWCAEAVTAWFILAYKKEAKHLMALSASCPRMIKRAKAMGIWVESDRYHPLPGDVVLYDWQDSGKGDNKGVADHVGIVSKTGQKNFWVIEGNKGLESVVGIRKLEVNALYIRGFIVPDYDGSEKAKISKMADDVLKGKYGNGEKRKKALGKYYEAVQKEVNRRLSKK